MQPILIPTVLAAALSLLSACVKVTMVPAETSLSQGVTSDKKIPLSLDLFLSPAFKEHALNLVTVRLLLGDAMSRGAERTASEAFRSVHVLGGAGLPSGKGDALMTAEIVDAYLKGGGAINKWKCAVSSRVTITAPGGDTIYMNTLTGQAVHTGLATAFNDDKVFAECMRLAIRDHYEKMLSDLTSRPWWTTIGRKEGI